MNNQNSRDAFARLAYRAQLGARVLERRPTCEAIGSGRPRAAIERIYVINLDRHSERWDRMCYELALIRFLLVVCTLSLAGTIASCDPIQGSGPGTPPDPRQFLRVDAQSRSAVLVLVAAYPVTDTQFNFDGYNDGALKLTLPVGWLLTVQCQNRGTVPHSCSIVSEAAPQQLANPAWSTPNPTAGIAPQSSASFEFTAERTGEYRIACLVPGHQDNGMWVALQVVAAGQPAISAA